VPDFAYRRPGLVPARKRVGIATAVIASVTQLFIGAYNPLLALGFLPYALLIALPICVIASILALSAGLGSRALSTRLVRSGRTGAITGGLGAVATGVAVALVMPAPWVGSVLRSGQELQYPQSEESRWPPGPSAARRWSNSAPTHAQPSLASALRDRV